MTVPISSSRKAPGRGNILNLLDFAIYSGPSKWCNNVTYDADKTITQLFITAKNFTVNATKTLTLTGRRPLVVVADVITINGTITASGKGCDKAGYSYTGWTWPFDSYANEVVTEHRNFCLCGAGGDSGGTGKGGGAYGAGGTSAAACDLTAAQLQELLFSPSFDAFSIGLGAGGGSSTQKDGGNGGGSILLIGRSIIVGAAANILANGVNGENGASSYYSGGGGGGGFVGLIGDTLSIDGGATISASGGAKGTGGGGDGYDGGDGAVAQIEV